MHGGWNVLAFIVMKELQGGCWKRVERGSIEVGLNM